MKDLSGKQVLMLSPQFFNYEMEIRKSLERLGAEVTWFDERPSNSFTTKVLIRLNKKMIQRKVNHYYQNILNQLQQKQQSFDFILLISPETISARLLRNFKEAFKDAKVILYMWDSFANKGALELVPLADRVLTFDSNDARKYNLILRPLFYIDIYKKIEVEEKYDLLFIGTAHSDRYNFVKKLIPQLPGNFRTKLYFFLSSKKLYWSRKMLDRNFRSIRYADVSFVSLSHIENSRLVHESNVVLDINHPAQIGLTMRTLETMGAQKKLITTNGDVVNYDFYDPLNILVIERIDPVIPKAFLTSKFNPSNADLLDKYSIQGWIKELFELK